MFLKAKDSNAENGLYYLDLEYFEMVESVLDKFGGLYNTKPVDFKYVIKEFQTRLKLFSLLKTQFFYDKNDPNAKLGTNSDAEWAIIKERLAVYKLVKEVFHGRSTFVEKTLLLKAHNTVNIEEISGLVAEIRIKMNLIM